MDITTRESGDANAIATAQQFGRTDWLFAVVLVATVFLTYTPCWNGGFLFDDDVLLLHNPVLKAGGLAKVWVPGGYLNYWPITSTVYWLEFQLWGLRPLGYHLVNLAIHALSALLVWRVLLRLRVPGAMFAAAIFALHPVNVESVAWIAQLKGLLSLMFALVSVHLYLSYEQHGSRWRYGLAIIAFLMSALAKGTALPLPIVLMACAWWQRGRIEWRDLLRVLPYFLIGAVMAGVEVWAQHNVAQEVIVRTDGFLSRAAVAGCAVWFYFGKFLLPVGLCPIYPRWTIDGQSMLTYLPGMLWLAMLASAWRHRRTWGRPVVMLIVCYSALLLPVLGFANIYFMRFSLVSDHWQYIAMTVPCAAFAGTCVTLAWRFLRRPAAIWTSISASVALSVVLAVLSYCQTGIYSDSAAFYEATIARNPDCWLAEDNLGSVQAGRGDFDSAIEHFRRALEIMPDYAEAHNNLAVALVARGQMDIAIAHYKRALAINPGFAAAHYDFAVALAQCGNVDSAVEHYRKALEIDPNLAGAHINLGNLLAGREDLDSAIMHFQRAIEIAPESEMARRNLAAVLAERERLRQAAPRKLQQSPPNGG